ncbi:MAG: hypothetical protein AAF757_01350 [Cyanobacteria bacterium P01_D01_bin.116]
MQQYYDIIIIGTGAGGEILAYALASIGKQLNLLKVFVNHFVNWSMQSQDLPNVENRVEIAKNKQIKVYYRLNKLQAHRRLRHLFEAMLRKAGLPTILGIPKLLKLMNHQGGAYPEGKLLNN